MSEELGHSLVVRVHPHLHKKALSDQLKWSSSGFLRNFPGVFLLEASSSVSSYELLDLADAVVTYGSTIGIESIYSGKPSILLCDSFYDQIGASVHKASSVSCLGSLLSSLDSLSVDRSSSLPYGYFMATFGFAYEIYKPFDLFSGSICGEILSDYPKTARHRLLSHMKQNLSSLGLVQR